ncbi:O-fucosyltransferase family protein [Forsythia ovata]|uniref:O-fucosyltransferase family protein n=1 Tax=Forsythia ovata TaxID=205694 RepID=A0ABD1RMM4_9LAMI
MVVVSGGMNQRRNQIVDAVVIARILGAALVVPILQQLMAEGSSLTAAFQGFGISMDRNKKENEYTKQDNSFLGCTKMTSRIGGYISGGNWNHNMDLLSMDKLLLSSEDQIMRHTIA